MHPTDEMMRLTASLSDVLGEISELATLAARLPAPAREREVRAEVAAACARAALELGDRVREGASAEEIQRATWKAFVAAKAALDAAERALAEQPLERLAP